MTAHKRSGHGIFKARNNKDAKSSGSLPGTILGPTPANPPPNAPSPPTPSTPGSASSSPPTPSSISATASSTAPSSATSLATSKSSSASASSTVSSASATTKVPFTTAVPPTYATPSYTNTDSFSYPALTSTAPSATSSSSSSVGGLSVGAIVGIVGGGLFGALILLMLGSYLLRWWRRHSAEHDFVDEYNEPAPDLDFSSSAGNTLRDPPMSQPTSATSFAGAGLAGQGIMATRAAMRTPGYGGGYNGYQNDDESISGAYSSQPQPQAPYNPEAYGAYVPYNGGGGAGYQEAVRGYQGQRAFEPPVNFGYAISEPPVPQAAYPTQSSPPPAPAPSNSPPPRRSISPTTGAPRTTASAALAAAKVAASTPVYKSPIESDQPRNSTAYSEQDAYGGF